MSGDTYIARAAALQVAAAIDKGGHFFCDQLPSMDVEEFLTALGEETGDGASVSLALVGYGVSETDLRYRFNALGLAVGHVTTDLHVAARWRNEPEAHSQIIALATGRHPGVSTLAHFPQGDTREFARSLLRWARTEEAGLASTLPQRTLVQVLEEKSELSPLVSLSGVAAFLATWQEARSGDELDAPRHALPRLGVLPDRNLLSQSDNVAERLLRNFKLTQDIARMPGRRLDEFRRRVKRGSPDSSARGLDVVERAERIRRLGDYDAYSALDYEEACEVFRPTSSPAPPADDPDEPTPPGVRDGQAVTRDGGELLIDGENEALEGLVRCIQEALAEAVDGEDESARGQYDVDGDEQRFEFEVEREVLTWVHHFCSSDAWGGVVETPSASFEDALRDYSQCDPTRFEPSKPSIPHDDERYDLRSLLDAMQRELSAGNVTTEDLCGLWDRMVAARRAVLGHLDILLHQPMLALAGQSPLHDAVTELLQACESPKATPTTTPPPRRPPRPFRSDRFRPSTGGRFRMPRSPARCRRCAPRRRGPA